MQDPTDAPEPQLTGKQPKRVEPMIFTVVVFVGFLVLAAILFGAVNVNVKSGAAHLLLKGFTVVLFLLALVGFLWLASYRSPKNPPAQTTENEKSPPP